MSINIVKKLEEINIKDNFINYLYEPRFSKKLDNNWKRHLFFSELKNDFIKDVSSFGFSPYIQETYSTQIKDKNIMKFKKKNYEMGFLNYIHRKYIKSNDSKNKINSINYVKDNLNHPYSCKSLEIRRLLFKEEKEKKSKNKKKNNKNNFFFKMMKIIKSKNNNNNNENNNLTENNINNNKNDNFLSKALKRIEEQKKKSKKLKKNKFYTNNNTNIDDIYDSDNEIIENDKLKKKFKIVKESHEIINREKNLPKYKKVFRKKVIKNQILKIAEKFQKDLFKTYKKNYSTSNSLRNSRKSIKFKNDLNFIISNNEKKFNNFEFENNENIQNFIKKNFFKTSLNKKNNAEKEFKNNILTLSNLNLKNINMNKILNNLSGENEEENENISTNDKTNRKKKYFFNLENASNGIFRQSIIQTQQNKRLKKIFAEEDKISDKYIIKIPRKTETFSKRFVKQMSKFNNN